MLSPPKSRHLDARDAVSLDDLVPREHLYRHLEAKLDLGFVRDWAKGRYAERGRPSIDSVVYVKLQRRQAGWLHSLADRRLGRTGPHPLRRKVATYISPGRQRLSFNGLGS